MNIVLLMTQVSVLFNEQKMLHNEECFDDFVFNSLELGDIGRHIKLYILTDISAFESRERKVGNIEIKLINVLYCQSVIPKWLKIKTSDKHLCWGDNYLLLHAKSFLKGPFLVVKDLALLKADFLNLVSPKIHELTGINRAYYFLSENQFKKFYLQKTHSAKISKQLVDCLNQYFAKGSTKEKTVCGYNLCVCEQCRSCVLTDIWILTPDFFDLAELQFESFLIENGANATVTFNIHDVLGDLKLKEIVKLNPIFK